MTILHYAASRKNEEMVKIILDKDPSLVRVASRGSLTPLHYGLISNTFHENLFNLLTKDLNESEIDETFRNSEFARYMKRNQVMVPQRYQEIIDQTLDEENRRSAFNVDNREMMEQLMMRLRLMQHFHVEEEEEEEGFDFEQMVNFFLNHAQPIMNQNYENDDDQNNENIDQNNETDDHQNDDDHNNGNDDDHNNENVDHQNDENDNPQNEIN
ncbi:hypothetical protein TRFO_11626 [Tritrichomonas foetus]|uniref:Uncharacterized protein n=1 Tax=Tritrichomonas foetus TaxID=1144522 RepID=A0A1J4J8T2_9EUKA|nr:hypothetical protein TRFO_11626 [Tritrichomonas foetus]|eukprot:OHS93636.1 hypothetical protein TRFO_11626 [Tritrichomonas foetus]